MIEKKGKTRYLGMGLTGNCHIIICEPIDLPRHFLCTNNNKNFFVCRNIPYHIGKVKAVHGEVNDSPPLSLPVPDTGAPFHRIVTEKVATPAADHVTDTLDNTLISSSQIHALCTQCPRCQADMGCHPLIALGAVTNPENNDFLSWHATFSAL